MAASKAQKFFSSLLLITAVWMFWLLKIDHFPSERHIFIYTFPIWLGVLFGICALLNVAYHLLVFRECPEAHAELMKEVKQAKSELAKKGIKVQ